jgi:hypothetical protein
LIALYISDKAANRNLKISSITCYLAAIKGYYEENGFILNIQHPAIRKVLKGIRNTLSKRPTQKEPLYVDELKTMVQSISIEKNGNRSLIGIRDRAILLLGFA